MKITIKNKGAFLLDRALSFLPYAVIFYMVAFIIAVIVMPLVLMKEISEIIGQISLVSLVATIFYMVVKLIDVYLYSKETFLQFDDNGVECVFSGFKRGRVSFSLSQVESMNVRQNLIDRILGLSQIEIVQVSGWLSAYGFDFKEASDFVGKFNSKHKTSK